MGLKFLEPDDKISYLHESLTPDDHGGLPDHDFYQKGKNPAILVIDMQRAYTSPEPKPWVREVSPGIQELVNQAIENTNTLIETARSLKVPVIYTGTRYLPDGSDCGIRREKFPKLGEYMREGLPWVDIDERLAPKYGEPIIWKKVASGFFGTYMVPILTHRNIDTCIVVGTATSGCVRAVTVDAVSANFRTVVAEECVTDRNIWAHKATLFDIWRYIATVAPLADITSWLKQLKN
jgi:maleamate amidohydrolase